jgi:hypothetical protein
VEVERSMHWLLPLEPSLLPVEFHLYQLEIVALNLHLTGSPSSCHLQVVVCGLLHRICKSHHVAILQMRSPLEE